MPKCSECAFLAVRDEYNSVVGEADEFRRDRGSHKSSIGSATRAIVLCFVDNPEFPPREQIPDEIVKRIASEHPCSRFRKWRPGRPPQAEEELEKEMEALKEFKRIEEERRAEQKKWNDTTEENIERRHKEQMAWNTTQMNWNSRIESNIERRHRWNFVLQFLLSLFTAVVALACYQLIPWRWNTRP